MNATIFFTLPYGIHDGSNLYLTASANEAGECLAILQNSLKREYDFWGALTFRVVDGMIFCGEISNLTPIGVLYKEGYHV